VIRLIFAAARVLTLARPPAGLRFAAFQVGAERFGKPLGPVRPPSPAYRGLFIAIVHDGSLPHRPDAPQAGPILAPPSPLWQFPPRSRTRRRARHPLP